MKKKNLQILRQQTFQIKIDVIFGHGYISVWFSRDETWCPMHTYKIIGFADVVIPHRHLQGLLGEVCIFYVVEELLVRPQQKNWFKHFHICRESERVLIRVHEGFPIPTPHLHEGIIFHLTSLTIFLTVFISIY